MSRELLAPVPQRDLADWPPERPLVSVVIPCFNYGHLVEEAVDSALGQTLTNLEVIVVEGGSTKVESRRQVANLRRPRTRVLFQEEAARAGANRNLGIENAQGKYIVCLDADDRLRPTFVEKAVFLAETFDVDVVSSAMQIFGDRSDRIDILEQPDLEAMLRGNHVLTCALFRKSFWAAAGGIRDGSGDGHIHEDWAFWIRLAAYGARFLNMPRDPLLLYRSHGPTLSTGENVHPMERQAQLVRSMNEDVVTDEALARSARLAAQERRKIPKPRPADYRLTSDRPGPVLLLAAPWLALGGAERLLSAIVGHLAEAGWRVIIVTSIDMSPDQGDTTDWFERHTAEIYNLPLFLGRQRWDAFLEHLLNSRQVDILWIVGSAYAYSRLVSVRVNHPNLRVVDLLFNTAGHTYNNRLRQNLIDLTLVENREVADWLQLHGESPERVKIIESGVDLEALAPGPRDQGVVRSMKLRPDEILVGFSGRWSEEKYPLAFVEIARRTDHSLPIRFVMTGAGPQRSLVESAVAKAGFPAGRFTLAGIVPDVVPWLRSYDLLVLPSLLDGRPLVVMEALSLGVPVLASRVGALPELIDHGTNGWLCEPGNIDDFVGHIEQFAQRPDRAALRELTRAHAVQHLDQRVMLARYRRALEGSLQGE